MDNYDYYAEEFVSFVEFDVNGKKFYHYLTEEYRYPDYNDLKRKIKNNDLIYVIDNKTEDSMSIIHKMTRRDGLLILNLKSISYAKIIDQQKVKVGRNYE